MWVQSLGVKSMAGALSAGAANIDLFLLVSGLGFRV